MNVYQVLLRKYVKFNMTIYIKILTNIKWSKISNYRKIIEDKFLITSRGSNLEYSDLSINSSINPVLVEKGSKSKGS